jgi:hypothetical protein
VLDASVSHQLSLGKIGRLDRPPPDPFISSLVCLVPKSHGSRRTIHHLSHPDGDSVNDHIPPEYGSLTYSMFDQALELVRNAGPGSVLVKRDLANVFRHIPVSPKDYWLLGFQWATHWYFDKFLPFGLRTPPFLFNLFSSALRWMLQHHFGWDAILHYLDDFLNIVSGHLPDAWAQAQRFGTHFDDLCTELGFKVHHKKSTIGTTTDFLGLEIDTIRMEARLPANKRLKALELVSSFLKRKNLSQSELQSIVGFLSFAAKVVLSVDPFFADFIIPSPKITRFASPMTCAQICAFGVNSYGNGQVLQLSVLFERMLTPGPAPLVHGIWVASSSGTSTTPSIISLGLMHTP